MEQIDKGDKRAINGFFLIVIGMILTTMLSFCYIDSDKSTTVVKIDVGKEIEFSDSTLMDEMLKLGIKEPNIVYSQALLETGHFKSNCFYDKHNLFGFNTGNGYMSFKSWKDCVHYYSVWQQKYYKGGDYYKFLTKIGYATDGTYVYKLKRMKKYGI